MKLSPLPLALLVACSSPAAAEPKPAGEAPSAAEWSAYWNQGKAEITSYDLTQARYGESHPGHAVLVFVTEPFSKRKQVKLDAPSRAGEDAVEVLKLNATRKFTTGLYPYSVMTSVFTPSRTGSDTIKVSASTQEWCGHVYSQLGLQEGGGYAGILRSYFESEGDRDIAVPPGATLEDAVWTLARVDPSRLPTGEVKMVPSMLYLRLRHQPVAPRPAKARLTREGDRLIYVVEYVDIPRSLRLELEAGFPHRILRFEERYRSGFGPGAEVMTTVGERNEELVTDYWTKNRRKDAKLRDALGLP